MNAVFVIAIGFGQYLYPSGWNFTSYFIEMEPKNVLRSVAVFYLRITLMAVYWQKKLRPAVFWSYVWVRVFCFGALTHWLKKKSRFYRTKMHVFV